MKSSNELKKMYKKIEQHYLSEAKLPQKVFKDAKSTYIIEIEKFLERDLEDIICLSKAEKASQLMWLPNIETIKEIPVMELNLSEEVSNVSELLKIWWEEENILFSFLEYGCLFNDKQNWIAHFSTELGLVAVGIFEKKASVFSFFDSSAMIKEDFLEQFEQFPMDSTNKVQQKHAASVNNHVVYPVIQNYFE